MHTHTAFISHLFLPSQDYSPVQFANSVPQLGHLYDFQKPLQLLHSGNPVPHFEQPAVVLTNPELHFAQFAILTPIKVKQKRFYTFPSTYTIFQFAKPVPQFGQLWLFQKLGQLLQRAYPFLHFSHIAVLLTKLVPHLSQAIFPIKISPLNFYY